MAGGSIRAHLRKRLAASLAGRVLCAADGLAAIEFAIVAPVFLTLLIGTFDLGQMAYAKAVLRGAVQQAARTSTLEAANTAAADAMVASIVKPVLPGVILTSTRTSYFDFADIGRPEQFDDQNNNGTCDTGEHYVDENGSGHWDADVGVGGNGGATDVVVYRVKAKYKPVFLSPFTPANWGQRTLTATAIKKNQPFSDQQEYGSTAGTCS